MNSQIARLFSIALTFVAITMVPAMAIAPANAAVAPQETRIARPGCYFGTDYTANSLHLAPRVAR